MFEVYIIINLPFFQKKTQFLHNCFQFYSRVPIFPPNHDLVSAFDHIDPEKFPVFEDYNYDDDNELENNTRTRRKRSPEFDVSVDLYPDEYCKIITELGKSVCSETSIIELWATDSFDDPETEATINSLTQEQIFDGINNKNFSEVYFEEKDFTPMLGGIERNSNGQIISAKATEIKFHGLVNVAESAADDGTDLSQYTKRIFADGPPADESTLEFEKALIEILLEMSKDNSATNDDIAIHFKTGRSFNDEASKAVESDIVRFIIGFIVVYIFVLFMIGGFGCVQQKVKVLSFWC
jgi:hypothetical protein